MKPQVFVSYSRERRPEVRRLVNVLDQYGINLWWDAYLKPSELWMKVIRENIDFVDFFILCISREILEKENSYVMEELSQAINAKKKSDIKEGWLIPICLDEFCKIPDIMINSKHNLKDLHCISIYESNLDNGLNDILTHILPKFTVRTEPLRVHKNSSKGINQSFLLGVYPVTIGEWHIVKGERPVGGDPNKPVTMVNWKEVQEFIEILNKRNEDKKIKRYRLPTETEWEYACRAESNGEFGFDGGEERLKEFAWYEKNSGGVTHPVGKLKPNKWGFYDMHGNVCEWVQDTRTVEPTHQNEGKDAITKGGSFDGNAQDHCRIDKKMWNPTILRYNNLGFRLAADPI